MYKLQKLNLASGINYTEYKVGFVEILYVKEDLTELAKFQILGTYVLLKKKRSRNIVYNNLD